MGTGRAPAPRVYPIGSERALPGGFPGGGFRCRRREVAMRNVSSKLLNAAMSLVLALGLCPLPAYAAGEAAGGGRPLS